VTKISIIGGGGQVGAATGLRLIDLELVDEVVLHDVVEGIPQGKGLDMYESEPVIGKDVRVRGTQKFEDLAGSDIVVVTAGLPRKPGMSRLDLLAANIAINKNASNAIKQHAPDSIVIYVANPVDLMTYVCWKITGFPTSRIVGMAGILDTSRFRTFVAMETGFSVQDIQALVMGGHGDSMVPLTRFSTISGIPVAEFIPKDRLAAIVERTKKGGGEIVELLKTGSAFYAPGAAIAQMCESIIKNKRRLLPCCSYLNGEYGFTGFFFGAPTILGKKGVEKVIELPLNDEEKAMLKKSAEELKTQVQEIEDKKMYA